MGKPGLTGNKGYDEKREKNNEAVRKSREKKREKEKLTMAELDRVREENRRMEEQIHRLESNIEILKGAEN
jgi:predicted nuclease with TOPRIM domain